MSTTQTTTPVRIAANHAVTKRLGNWTTGRHFQVHAHRGVAVLDLRSAQIPVGDQQFERGVVQLGLDLDVAAGNLR